MRTNQEGASKFKKAQEELEEQVRACLKSKTALREALRVFWLPEAVKDQAGVPSITVYHSEVESWTFPLAHLLGYSCPSGDTIWLSFPTQEVRIGLNGELAPEPLTNLLQKIISGIIPVLDLPERALKKTQSSDARNPLIKTIEVRKLNEEYEAEPPASPGA